MSERFRSCSLDQPFLMPPSLHDWLPMGHLARFLVEIVETLDLQSILEKYARKDRRGAAGYHPAMLVRILLYGYCVGAVSSRKIEKATHEDVAFRYLAADQHPDHDTIANFRRAHLEELGGLFTQVLELCREAGLLKVGRVMLDGTKMGADASRRKTMKQEKLEQQEAELKRKVEELLREAEAVDAAEDAQYGKGRRGDELPAELADPQRRLERIREAKARLEERNRQRAKEAEEDKKHQKASGEPASAAQKKRWQRARQAAAEALGTINLTDMESQLMKDGNRGGYVQGYNAQAAVLDNQVIVALEVTAEAADKQQLVPMAGKVQEGLGGLPTAILADSGYFSEEAVTDPSLQGIELLVPPDRSKPGEELKPNAPRGEAAQKMREKLQTEEARSVYRLRGQTIEPVFGQIKAARGLRRFLFRGLERVRAEWRLIGLTHNLLKLFRYRSQSLGAPPALALRYARLFATEI
jgi:transposase